MTGQNIQSRERTASAAVETFAAAAAVDASFVAIFELLLEALLSFLPF